MANSDSVSKVIGIGVLNSNRRISLMIFIIIPLQLGNMYLECGEWQKVSRSLKLYLLNV